MLTTISRNGFLLAIFAIICTAAVATVNQLTKPAIAKQEQMALLKTINQLIPESSYDNDIFASCFTINDDNLLGKGQSQQVFVAKKGEKPVALMLETSTFKGYAGEIKLAIGIFADGKVAGVRAIRHTETPGLGDKIQVNKSDWIYSFTGKHYEAAQDSRWEVTKNGGDIDAFTGATITPRAVTLAVKDALIYFDKNQQMLFNQTPNCGAL
ncbi:electron transport complex subunit RsxG [Psychromonas sp. psych-6C06]|uniref:electron transport complex subunit RsxG n=1 Tax=Psychromonas sp. psych-6C06 TaxID=2058089 RepID=UPI000C3359D0|nr:electron transport complex subunit RsxG [Psychromonas sp. psych-6C06]PKF63403.1 electron transport complex subunit RsxG [Psychromonas sp. psych-6C06]